MLLDHPIRLTGDAGNGVNKACLMTASNMLIGRGCDGDDNSCVCPVLRAFIIPTNDKMAEFSEELLGELYGPLAWEIIGTRTDDLNVMVKRCELLVGVAQELARDEAHARNAAQDAARYARNAARYARGQAAYDTACSAAMTAARAAIFASASASAATKRNIWEQCRDAIRAAAAIGDKCPVECVVTPKQLAASLAGQKGTL